MCLQEHRKSSQFHSNIWEKLSDFLYKILTLFLCLGTDDGVFFLLPPKMLTKCYELLGLGIAS